ncbi:MAG: glutamate 5-kinase, partial [Burkholderiaceae bacterium]
MTGILKDARRIVVKVGSSLVTDEGRGVDAQAIGNRCRQLAELARDGREVIMVSSGAIAEGMKRLGWVSRPKELHELQAAAAVGQMGLAQMYETKLREQGLTSAQVLLTHADLADRERYLNARSTLLALLQHRVLPVINENDTVVNDEIKFGDNDTLGALVANLVEADALIILTDQKGLYSADPRKDPNARFIDQAIAGKPELEEMAGGEGSSLGRGGMITKILAAKRAAGSGASTVIAWGREPDVLVRLAAGEAIGTALVANLVDADALVILTDQRGLYSADPRKDPNARFIDEARAGSPELELMAGGAGSAMGRGGMLTKILAAKRAAGSGTSTVIAWGREPDVLLRLAAGEAIGTALRAGTPKLAARKQWMVDHLQLRGAVAVDEGAAHKLREEGKSLLPIGVHEVQGEFVRGDVIAVRTLDGIELARGLANYSSAEARLIA